MTTPQAGDLLTYADNTGDGPSITRTGTVWSEGPSPSTVWVQPEHDRSNPVLVKLPTPARIKRGETPTVDSGYPAGWQRDTVRRCDNLMRHGVLYQTLRSLGRHGSTEQWERIQHVDPGCPSANELTREPSPWSIHQIIDSLLGRPGWCNAKLCSRCVNLDENAELGASV